MLGSERKTSRLVRVSIAGILLVVVVCVVAAMSNSAGSVVDKNMMVATETNFDDATDTTSSYPETEMTTEDGTYQTGEIGDTETETDLDDEDEPDYEDGEIATEDEDEELAGTDEFDEIVPETDIDMMDDGTMYDETAMEVEEDYLPKQILLCDKVCAAHFKNPKKLAGCKKECKDDMGDASSPQKCYKDCKKACNKVAPNRKICKKNCLMKFCPRPLRFCLNMCVKIGLKHFKKPKGVYIKKCKAACFKDKNVRARPKKCKKKCKKACRKFVAKGKGRRRLCKKDCKKLCPQI